MFRRICISLAALFFGTQFLSSCCDCEEFPVLHADWTGINAAHGYYTDSAYIAAFYDPGLDYGSRNLVLFLSPKLEVVARNEPSGFLHLGAFAKTAYACSCKDYQVYEMRRNITAISVRTLRDFDGQHLRGSDITAYFRQTTRDGRRLADGPVDIPEGPYDPRREIALFLSDRPTAGSTQQFELSMSVAGGTIFRDTTGIFSF